MMSINLGPIALPVEPMLLLGSVLIGALVATVLARKNEGSVTDPLLTVLFFGLIVGRIVFVIRFADQYDSFWQMLDFRDRGVDLIGSLIAMGLMLLWQMRRLPHQHLALLGGAVAMMFIFSSASLWLNAEHKQVVLPDILIEQLSGEEVSLALLANNQVTVVNLWASWCPPCQREMPAFYKAEQDYPEINFIMLNQQESAHVIKHFLARMALDFNHVMLDYTGQIADAFNAYGLPVTLFFNQQGKLINSHMGEMSAASLSATINRIAQ